MLFKEDEELVEILEENTSFKEEGTSVGILDENTSFEEEFGDELVEALDENRGRIDRQKSEPRIDKFRLRAGSGSRQV